MRGLAVLGFLLLCPAAWASQAQSYAIDLRYDPGTGKTTATAKIALKPEPKAPSIVFYLHDELRVTAVRMHGKAVTFRQKTVAYDYNYDTKANRIEVPVTGRDVSGGLQVVYAGRFSPSAARSPSDYMRGDRDGLYLRSYGYSLWFPVFAASGASFSAVDFAPVRITTPADFRAVFVGEEVSRVEKNGWATATWRAPVVGAYDAQLTVRRFAVKRRGAVETYYLNDPVSERAADRILAFSEQLLAYYRSHYRQAAGRRTVHLVQEPAFGDIASGNMIGLSDARWRQIKSDGTEIETLAHELVHAFVQTPTAKNDPLYAFEIEGFPSYFHLPALESILGTDWYDSKLDTVQRRYVERRATGRNGKDTLPPEKSILALTADEVGTYKDVFVLNDRALLFWDALRRSMGKKRFDAMVRSLTSAPEVTAASFFAIIRAQAPELEADAHLWLETTDYPEHFRRPNPD